jgi:hypothetical protein
MPSGMVRLPCVFKVACAPRTSAETGMLAFGQAVPSVGDLLVERNRADDETPTC